MKTIFYYIKKAISFLSKLSDRFAEITEKHRLIYVIRAICRAWVLYALFILAYRLVCSAIPDLDDYYEDSGRIELICRAIFVFLIYHTLVRTFRVFDTRARRHFVLSKQNGDSWLKRAKNTLFSSEFIIETIMFFVLTCIPLARNTYLHKEVILAIFYKQPIEASTERLLVLAIYLPLYLIIGFFANMSARSYWVANKKEVPVTEDPIDVNDEFVISKNATRLSVKNIGGNMRRERFWFERKQKKLVDYLPVFLSDLWGMLSWIVIGLVVYDLGLMIIPAMITSISSIVVLVVTKYLIEALSVLLALAIIIPIIMYQRKFRKRHQFIKKLKKLCKKEKFEISYVYKPYSFKDGDKRNLTIIANGKTYDCKFIAAKKKYSNTTFYEDGSYVSRSSIKPFFRIQAARIDTFISYTFEGEHQKILILNPTPRNIFVYHGGVTRELDVGDTVCGYKLYTGSSLLNALERDCVERKANT